MTDPDLREQLQTTLGDAYTLERELGGGGMSRVFVAEEVRLRRKVVVKVLTPELAAGISGERFEREIRLAAQLSHPTIVPVLSAGDTGGMPYYTMPFVEGLSLRARLSTGDALSIGETLSILRDIARALAYAHERGIVHRDIKPENVLLAGDAAVVTDFGIAKAISAARTDVGDATLTRAGTTVGTPAYMAPEQATGDPATDHRADLYSFGCLAYEILTGETPFHGRPIHKMLAAHMGEPAPDLQLRRPDVPPSLRVLVMRCLEKDPNRRPLSAREVLQALDSAATPAGTSGSRTAIRLPRLAIFTVVAGAGILAAWGVWTTARRGAGSGPAAVDSETRSIAVLPFENVGGDTADAYFADGIAEEVGTALSKVPGLNVLARSSVARFRNQEVAARDVGRTLGVSAVLEGTVRRAGQQMRITPRLISIRDGRVLWSDSYEREIKDVFAVQDEITQAIAEALRAHFTLAPPTSAKTVESPRGTTDLGAYDLYLRGQFLLHRRGPAAALAADNFEKAIARDPGFARAYSGLSAALELFPYFVGGPSAPAVHDRATEAARRALSLDSTLSEPHMSLAMAYEHAYQWDAAEHEFRRAVALDPNDASARHQFARFLLYTGRSEDALDEIRRAKALDPYAAYISSWLCYAHLLAGAIDSARAEGRWAMEIDSTSTTAISFTAFIHLATGDNRAALATVDRLPRGLPWLATIAYVHGAAGDREGAQRIVRELEQQRPRPWFGETAIAMGSLGVGDTARALDALERATDAREIWPAFWPISDRLFSQIRSSPRFAAVAGRVGLDVRRFHSIGKR